MILNFTHLFNPNYKQSSFQDDYDKQIHKCLHSFACPNCKGITFMKLYNTYKRNLFLTKDSFISINITVLQCPECNSCHAILPAFFLAFSSYSYPFILETLHLYLTGSFKNNKTKVCEYMNISRNTLNHFLRIFTLEEVRSHYKSICVSKMKDIISHIKSDGNKLYRWLSLFFSYEKQFVFFLTTIIHRKYIVDIFISNNMDK